VFDDDDDGDLGGKAVVRRRIPHACIQVRRRSIIPSF
jgi:hypothetical protein